MDISCRNTSIQRVNMHPTKIEVDLRQFKKNLFEIRTVIGNRLFLLPIKANAYGLGLLPIAKAGLEAGVDYLGVAFAKEAIELRQEGIGAPILVLGAILEEQFETLINYGIEITLSSHMKAALLSNITNKLKKPCRVHIEVDTGMARTGMRPETALALFLKLNNHPFIQVVGIYSHLATSNIKNHPFCLLQLKAFDQLMNKIDPAKKLISHIANSGAIEHFNQELCLRQMVRPGVLCFGYSVTEEWKNRVKPCFTLKSKISFFKVLEKDSGISYGHSYRTKSQTRIVTVPIGYGDGYRRILSNSAQVLIRSKRYPIVGNICMDQLMVDIGLDEAYVGDEVVLIGKQGALEISIEEVAHLCKSVPYEIFSGFTSRIPRSYVT